MCVGLCFILVVDRHGSILYIWEGFTCVLIGHSRGLTASSCVSPYFFFFLFACSAVSLFDLYVFTVRRPQQPSPDVVLIFTPMVFVCLCVLM